MNTESFKLYAPSSYWKYSKEALEELVNGCGPRGWKGRYIPDSLIGVSIKEACNIHDFMYAFGEKEEDREQADRVLLNNMMRTVEACSGNWFSRWIRRKLALHYYGVVRDMGGTYFWHDKNPEGTVKNPEEVFNNGVDKELSG